MVSCHSPALLAKSVAWIVNEIGSTQTVSMAVSVVVLSVVEESVVVESVVVESVVVESVVDESVVEGSVVEESVVEGSVVVESVVDESPLELPLSVPTSPTSVPLSPEPPSSSLAASMMLPPQPIIESIESIGAKSTSEGVDEEVVRACPTMPATTLHQANRAAARNAACTRPHRQYGSTRA